MYRISTCAEVNLVEGRTGDKIAGRATCKAESGARDKFESRTEVKVEGWKRDKVEVGSRGKTESRAEQEVKLKAEQEGKQAEKGSRVKSEGTAGCKAAARTRRN